MQLFAVNFIPLPGYCMFFGRFTYPSSGVQFQLYRQPLVEIMVSSQLPSSSVVCRLLYVFRAFYIPIIRSTISTVSTASGRNHAWYVGYSTCFGHFTYPSSGVQFQLYLQPLVHIMVSSKLPSSNVACYLLQFVV